MFGIKNIFTKRDLKWEISKIYAALEMKIVKQILFENFLHKNPLMLLATTLGHQGILEMYHLVEDLWQKKMIGYRILLVPREIHRISTDLVGYHLFKAILHLVENLK